MQIHQQLSKFSRAEPGFTASTRLSQGLALPSIPHLPERLLIIRHSLSVLITQIFKFIKKIKKVKEGRKKKY